MADLVILGNGFDLSVGMGTSYKHFFDKSVKCDNDIYTITYFDGDKARNYEFSYWDIVFRKVLPLCKGIENWYEVEEVIALLIQDIPTSKILNHDYIDDFYYRISGKVRLNSSNGYCSTIPNGLENVKKELVQYTQNRLNSNLDEYLIFLMNELHKFENEFARYIEVVDKNSAPIIDEDINEKLKSILMSYEGFTDLYKEIPEKHKNLTILSFNYTSSIRDFISRFRLNSDRSNWSITNIHGLAKNKDVIFGMDANLIDEFSPIKFRFTKTARILNSKQAEDVKANIVILPKKVNCIRFYGHSLNEYDYSYFQSIFDYYDLYKSNVRLKFFFSEYKKNAKDEQMERIVKLLKKYGETLDNKDHGKNLLHKLILEKRLSLKKI